MEDSVPASSIGAVERETGLTKDVLRVWERRYGFPSPSRDSNGERLYGADQVERLRLIRKLMDLGVRPGKIVMAPASELQARLRELEFAENGPAKTPYQVEEALALLMAHKASELHAYLRLALLRLGLKPFVEGLAAPLSVAVGGAWARGALAVYQEHCFSEQLQLLLHHAIGSAPPHHQKGPRILLTTLPGEEHRLGLTMVQAYLTVEGVQCVSLGPQTPVSDVARAALAFAADVVGLSFSSATKLSVARTMISELRAALDPSVPIWAGGAIWRNDPSNREGVLTLATLADVSNAVEAWREQAARDVRL